MSFFSSMDSRVTSPAEPRMNSSLVPYLISRAIEQLEALDIHLIVLSERSRHCYPGALEIHHDNSLTFKKLKMCIAKSRNALVALKNVISFPA